MISSEDMPLYASIPGGTLAPEAGSWMPVMPWESLYSSMSFAIISGVGSPEGICDEDWDGADGSMVLAGVVGSSWFGAAAWAGVISSMWPMLSSI